MIIFFSVHLPLVHRHSTSPHDHIHSPPSIIMIGALQILLFLVFLGFWWYLRDKAKYSKYPPGPPRLPFIGNLLQLLNAEFPSISLAQLSKTYGPVVHVKMGLVDAVVFNSHEVVSDILAHDKAAGKKHDLLGTIKIRSEMRNLGIIFGNGEPWQVLRRFTIRTLRDFGFGKAASMDVVINEEYDKFSAHLKKRLGASGGVIQAEEMFELPIVNILWRLVTGVNYEYGDPKINKLLRISDIMMKSTNFAFDSTVAFPFLFDMFPGWSGKHKQIEINEDLKDFARDTIKEHKQAGDFRDNPQCYVDVFLSKMEETKDEPGTCFTPDQFVLCLIDLFQAGSETSSKSLAFSIIYMILHPEVQEKIQAEIDRQVGPSESIVTATKLKLPYTQATILESLRMASVLPFPPPRMALEDFKYMDHFIKKGTPLLVNQQAAHYDPEKWIDPYNFRPDRFLTKEGTVDSKMASSLVAFGGGKRVCLGQNLAEMSVFIYFTSLLRDYKVQSAPGEPAPSPVPKPGLTYSPRPFKVKFIPRK